MKIAGIGVQNSYQNIKSKNNYSQVTFEKIRSTGAILKEAPQIGFVKSLILIKAGQYPAKKLFTPATPRQESIIHYVEGLVKGDIHLGHNLNFEHAKVTSSVKTNKDITGHRCIIDSKKLFTDENIDFERVNVEADTMVQAKTYSQTGGRFNAELKAENAQFNNVTINYGADIKVDKVAVFNIGTTINGNVTTNDLQSFKKVAKMPSKGRIVVNNGANAGLSTFEAKNINLNGSFNGIASGETIVVGENAKIGDLAKLKAKHIIFNEFLPEKAHVEAEQITLKAGNWNNEIVLKSQDDVPEEYTNIKIIPNVFGKKK